MADFIFLSLAVSVGVCALLTVISRHIFHSAVWLSMCLLGIAAIYFYLEAEFIGVIQILVYIGGIITLFIFAIKLTAHIDDVSIPQRNKQTVPSALASLILFTLLMIVIGKSPWAPLNPSYFSLEDLGHSLMTTYVLPFEMMSLILLAVMIGAIVIGKVKK